MPGYYTYLISSLPMLYFAAKLPFSFENFLLRCSELIPPGDWSILNNLNLQPPPHPVIEKFQSYETALRNELVKIRSARKKTDPARFLRADGYAGPTIYHICLAAYRNPSIIEGQKILDKARWEFLEELSLGHYFDLGALIIYGYKLKMLERWAMINNTDKDAILNSVLPNAREA